MPLVALHDELVCATDELERVLHVELGGHVRAEEEAGAARRHAPPESVVYGLQRLDRVTRGKSISVTGLSARTQTHTHTDEREREKTR